MLSYNSKPSELRAFALSIWANHIETGEISLSAEDANNSGKKVRPLDDEQKRLVLRLRELALEDYNR